MKSRILLTENRDIKGRTAPRHFEPVANLWLTLAARASSCSDLRSFLSEHVSVQARTGPCIQDSPESIWGWSCTAMCSCTRPMWVWGVHRSSAVQCEIGSCIGRGCSGLSMLPCQPPHHIGSDTNWIQARILWISITTMEPSAKPMATWFSRYATRAPRHSFSHNLE